MNEQSNIEQTAYDAAAAHGIPPVPGMNGTVPSEPQEARQEPEQTAQQATTPEAPESEGAPAPAELADGDLIYVMVSEIGIAPNFNPRTYFDPKAMDELIESIRTQGLIQPITVRPNPDREGHYFLVAGERRFRACQQAMIEEVPVIVRDVDEEAAFALSTSENTVREDMSAAEEAKAAQRVLSASNGDRDEAAKRLGWSRTKIDSRLAILHATESVLNALTKREIKIGHAELLASLNADMQESTLKTVIANKIGVAALKDKLGSFAQALEEAVFDTADCAGCPHNSTEQASLFDESIAGGRCTNRVCWTEKEQAFARTKRDELAEELPQVKLDTESDPNTRTILRLDDVGREQLLGGCKSCASFGCVMSTKPGEIGEVTKEVCFDLSCHKEKVADHKEQMTALNTATQSASAPAPTSAPASTPATGSTPSAKQGKTTAKSAATPGKVVDQVVKRQTDLAYLAAKKSASAITVQTAALLIHQAISKDAELPKEYRGMVAKRLAGGGVKLSGYPDHKAVVEAVATLYAKGEQGVIEAAQNEAVAVMATKPDNAAAKEAHQRIPTGQRLLTVAGVRMERAFTLDREFLEAHTKSGVGSLMVEAGFDKWLDEKEGKGAFKKLMGKKNAEVIDGVLNAGFDFTGFVPAAMEIKAGK